MRADIDGGPRPGVTFALAEWLGERVEHLVPPVRVERVGTGQSNLTSVISDAEGREWILRYPAGGRADVRREARILRALAATSVPVPAVVAEGRDAAGIEGGFLVMERMPGRPLEDEADAGRLSPPERRAVGDEAVELLATLHALDPESVGLGDLGRRDGYLTRQLARSAANWAAWGTESAADAVWREGFDRLSRAVPTQQRCVIVHGDYRLSNILVADGRLSSVLDWELCTLGDPLADLAWLVDDWRGPEDPSITIPSPTRVGGFADRAEIVADYAGRTGLNVEHLGYYRAFTHWRAATLLQGVAQRRRAGSLGVHGALDLLDLEHSIRYLLDGALHLVGG
ncbi:phosphotransferase family protein [Pseudonocardia halophobica]|uniref:Acyl-CoA dehydrogenase n=1 Tax=Pseudonocardia halophobica TaxID=29401 RepID=A0A9W6KYX6_9PSEU|nr:phosphotransferase family protein [Pseudonocardia halophobica]GLL09832.1 acyl-CoA dehydrogenase [Pseudonocardia halophobica]